jgi:hypothetical protein
MTNDKEQMTNPKSQRCSGAAIHSGILCAALVSLCAGCATVSVGPVRPQEGVHPAATAPDAPLVLAIPGLRIPALPVTQEQHFGHLVEMLAAEGIPCRILTYDTRENPLSRDAALFSPDLAIAWTRVGPAAVHELQRENERRDSLGLPPVKKIVLFGYSQGAVIMEQIATKIFYGFRRGYEEMQRQFGGEWEALQNDPEFNYFMNALEDFLVLRNIKVQREKDFDRDPDMKLFYRRSEMKADRQFDEFIEYLIDPSVKYPNVTHFEEPESPMYPKRYRKVKLCAEYGQHCSLEQRERIKNFFMDYAEYRYFLDVKPSFITAAGSFFGSPRATESIVLFKWFPFLKLFARRELNQIIQTQLGTKYQWKSMENLVRMNRDEAYPIDPDNTLFIVGANGKRGDGLVDQSSAHLSDHSFQLIRVNVREGARGEAKVLEQDRLPDLVVVPLRVMHFPEKVMWGLGGRRYGAAYMEEGNPAWPYVLSFVRGDWVGIGSRLSRGEKRLAGEMLDLVPLARLGEALAHGGLRQFMLEVALPGEELQTSSVSRGGTSRNVHIDGRYHNPKGHTWVWTGHFDGPGQEMNLLGPETVQGAVDLTVHLPRGMRVPLSCAVYPGCNSFIKLEAGGGAAPGGARQ